MSERELEFDANGNVTQESFSGLSEDYAEANQRIATLESERDEYKSKCEGMFEAGGFEYFNQQLTDERAESSRLRNAIELMKKERNELNIELAATKRECEGLREVVGQTLDGVPIATLESVYRKTRMTGEIEEHRVVIPDARAFVVSYGIDWVAKECYSTEQAARDATEGGGS